MSHFDEQPEGDPHGECALEILRLRDERDTYLARCVESEIFAGTLAVHVAGYFAMPDENGKAICLNWVDNVHKQCKAHEAEREEIKKAQP